jgi:hypothetical protein
MILDKFKQLKDDQIGDGIYIAFDWTDEKHLCRIYLGSKTAGPILQYDYGDLHKYIGEGRNRDTGHFPNGAWTPIYSRGDFGKRYAYGGHWSGHCKSLHPDIMAKYDKTKDNVSGVIEVGDKLTILPSGILGGDITCLDLDPSVGWAIWFATAKEAMQERLTRDQIIKSTLPSRTRDHLLKNETFDIIGKVMEVIEVYKL